MAAGPSEPEQAWPLPVQCAAMAEPGSAESESQIVTDPAVAAERTSPAVIAHRDNPNDHTTSAASSSSAARGRPPRLTGRALVPDQVFLVWAILALFMMVGLVGLASFYIFLQSNHLFSLPAELARQRNTTRVRV
ncbi:hypothetical protein HPB52_014831 [Rhipicephalus sanguineus]|uniref:Uncharacterized protein n=1 Tax=Rhipicephalus sanguineus TaxID=34632 RepID=A0A9D4PFM8_RHISA|nr:hypothetical protein HPB52_014831 [Rhipicephalus sanguineus]